MNEKLDFGEHDIIIATAALYYHVISVDGSVNEVELVRFRSLLADRFGMDEAEIQQLETSARDVDLNSPGVFPFTVILNRELDDLERHRVFSQLNALAMADGVVHELERDFLAHIKQLLKL